MIITENYYGIIEEKLNQLIDQIYETRFLNKEELRDKLFLFIRIMIKDVRESQVFELEEKRVQIARQIGIGFFEGTELSKAQARLQWINTEINHINKTAHAYQQFHEYSLLKKYIRSKFGEETLKEFYAQTEKDSILNP